MKNNEDEWYDCIMNIVLWGLAIYFVISLLHSGCTEERDLYYNIYYQ